MARLPLYLVYYLTVHPTNTSAINRGSAQVHNTPDQQAEHGRRLSVLTFIGIIVIFYHRVSFSQSSVFNCPATVCAKIHGTVSSIRSLRILFSTPDWFSRLVGPLCPVNAIVRITNDIKIVVVLDTDAFHAHARLFGPSPLSSRAQSHVPPTTDTSSGLKGNTARLSLGTQVMNN